MLLSNLDRLVSLSHLEHHFKRLLLNFVLAVKMRRRLKLHSRFLQVSSSAIENNELNDSSHFFITNTENDFQILRLSERKADVFVQVIRPDAQTALKSGFVSY